MKDGDYRDIWLATAFAVVVLLAGKLLLEESKAAAGLVMFVAFTGGTLIMQHVADRERRKRGEGD
jgi:hypothetical protein